MSKTSIEWCDHSINPIRASLGGRTGHYCVKTSPGCKNCYSSRMQSRFGMPAFPDQQRTPPKLWLDETKLDEVLRRRKPTRYFWADMTDLFGSWVPGAWVVECFATMALTPQHTHLVLTKRPEHMFNVLAWMYEGNEIGEAILKRGRWKHQPPLRIINPKPVDGLDGIEGEGLTTNWPLPNVHLGVSVEDRARKTRIDTLRETPAALRFLSLEPLLEHLGKLNLDGIDQAIVGAESGPGARPMDEGWVRSIRDQCQAAGVAFFYKQRAVRGKKISLPELDGRQWAEFPA